MNHETYEPFTSQHHTMNIQQRRVIVSHSTMVLCYTILYACHDRSDLIHKLEVICSTWGHSSKCWPTCPVVLLCKPPQRVVTQHQPQPYTPPRVIINVFELRRGRALYILIVCWCAQQLVVDLVCASRPPTLAVTQQVSLAYMEIAAMNDRQYQGLTLHHNAVGYPPSFLWYYSLDYPISTISLPILCVMCTQYVSLSWSSHVINQIYNKLSVLGYVSIVQCHGFYNGERTRWKNQGKSDPSYQKCKVCPPLPHTCA